MLRFTANPDTSIGKRQQFERAAIKAREDEYMEYKKLASITVGYLDMETMNIVDTQMYIDGYQVKLVSDTSYGSLWEVSFTLKEF